ncbi:CoA-transferase [Sphingomonas sp. MMS24-JH45]
MRPTATAMPGRGSRAEIDARTFDAEFAEEARTLGHELRGEDVLAVLAGDIRPRMVHALDWLKRHGYHLGCITNNVPAGEGAGMARTAEKAAAVGEVLARFDHVVDGKRRRHPQARSGDLPHDVRPSRQDAGAMRLPRRPRHQLQAGRRARHARDQGGRRGPGAHRPCRCPGGREGIVLMRKLYADAASALDGLLFDGMTICAGGFGFSGIPERLIDAIQAAGTKELTIASNNAGIDGEGLGKLLRSRQVRKMISSYVGENKEFERQYLAGELEVEYPQGTLAERCRAGGAVPASTPKPASARRWPRARRSRSSTGREYILERGIRADLAVVRGGRPTRAVTSSSARPRATSTSRWRPRARSASRRWRRWCRWEAAGLRPHPPARHLRKADDRRALRQEDRVPHHPPARRGRAGVNLAHASLAAGGAGSALAAAMHLACIVAGAPMYRVMGAGEGMALMAERGDWTPHLVTFAIAAMLAVWAPYAWSGAGLIARLPLLRYVLAVIAAIYLLRGLVIVQPALLRRPDLSPEFLRWSSAASLALGLCYAAGAWRLGQVAGGTR